MLLTIILLNKYLTIDINNLGIIVFTMFSVFKLFYTNREYEDFTF